MKRNLISLFPNYAVIMADNQFWLEPSHPLMIDPIVRKFGALMIAASVCMGDLPGNYIPLKNIDVKIISLGRVNNIELKIGRGMKYLFLVPRIAQVIWLSKFCYIFAPGHVGLLAIILCRLMKRPYGLYLRGEWRDATPHWIHRFYPRAFVNAKFVLCTGAMLANQVREMNPRCEAVVPMSPVLFSRAPICYHKVAEGSVTILFVGQMIRKKGIFDLLDALQILREKHYLNAQLIMVGEGSERANLEQTIEAKGLTSYVHCIGMITESERLANVYQQSDIFCLPTCSEGFPRVLYEAMRFSLPIVTTAVGQIGTVIENGRNGLFHPPNDTMALVDCLLRLIRDPALRSALGEAGHRTLVPLLQNWKGQTHGHQVVKWLKLVMTPPTNSANA